MPQILGLNIDPGVKNEIDIRQSVLSNLEKQTVDNLVFNSKTSWVKLASSVDIEPSRAEEAAKFIGIDKSLIEKTNLAKNLVLFGGVLKHDDNFNPLPLLGGYGYGLNNAYGFLSRNNDINQGYKPMPGITNVSVKYKNNGTLKQATINITAHTLPQFQAIELLYLRLGYTVLLEWGHTDWFLDDTEERVKATFSKTLTNNFLKGDYNNSFGKLVRDIKKIKTQSSYNYDAMYAKVSNYSWVLNTNLGYDITIDLISLGDIIESLKFNTISTYNPIKINTSSTDDNVNLSNVFLNKGNSSFNAFLYDIRNRVIELWDFSTLRGNSDELDKIIKLTEQQVQAEQKVEIKNTNISSIIQLANELIQLIDMNPQQSGYTIFSTLSGNQKRDWGIVKEQLTNSSAWDELSGEYPIIEDLIDKEYLTTENKAVLLSSQIKKIVRDSDLFKAEIILSSGANAGTLPSNVVASLKSFDVFVTAVNQFLVSKGGTPFR